MRSGSHYKSRLSVRSAESDEGLVVDKVLFAECTPCPAGKQPRASCKHLAALMFALEEFTRLGYTRDPGTCTDILQAWNKPHRNKAEPVQACDLDFGRSGTKQRKKRTAAELCDPRAAADRGKAEEAAKEIIRRSQPGSSGFSMVAGDFLLREILAKQSADQSRRERLDVVDSLQVAWKHQEDVFGDDPSLDIAKELQPPEDLPPPSPSLQPHTAESPATAEEDFYARYVVVDAAVAEHLREATVTQASCSVWFKARSVRVTASSVKKILHRKQSTDPSKLVEHMTSTSSVFSNEAVVYGRVNERNAITRYSQLMSQVSGTDVVVEQSGFVVRPDYPWLGASPDGVIRRDDGLVEVKCPYVCKDMSFRTAVTERRSKFCLEMNGSNGLRLRRDHEYFYQIATQLFVTRAKYCDFIFWSPTEMHIERIFPHLSFAAHVDSLQEFYFKHMLPRLV